MGKALYREYRPKSLGDVVGQEHITNTLQNAIKKGSISHAYLFTGPRGVGKTSVARILAHEINGIPYNDESTEIDIIEIDAASNRRIEEIRDLRDKVHIAPTSSKYKVYIIDEVHMLTREAFNALLKTLEEPPAHVVFILATTESHKVPETIISRTQRFSFKPITKDSITNHLRIIADKEIINISDDALLLLAEHGNGSFRDSISMLDQIAGFSESEISTENISLLLGVPDSTIIESLIHSAFSSNVEALFSSMQKLRESGANPSKTAQSIIQNLKNIIMFKNDKYDNRLTVDIMKSLLSLTGTHASFQAIEIALLDSMRFKSTAPVEITEVEQTKISNNSTNKISKRAAVPEIKIEIPEENLEKVINDAEIKNDSSWNDVLKLLKSKHNTLYGVLRMAETKVEKDKITLTFQFEFHKKQLHHAKNLATLKAIVDETLGRGYSIESEVVKKQKNIVVDKQHNDQNNTLSSVSNIFGGAELLES
jgi:DNA polymerase III subunit gamma/tau